MKILPVNDDLELELWPAGDVSEYPAVTIKNKAVDDEGAGQFVIVHSHEIRHLMAALAQAAVLLASPSVLQDNGSDDL